MCRSSSVLAVPTRAEPFGLVIGGVEHVVDESHDGDLVVPALRIVGTDLGADAESAR